jgi:large subunit ribosomal protein L25
VLYGGDKQPETLSCELREVLKQLDNEAFYSHILQVKVDSRIEQAVLRDIQRHPFKPVVMHLDLQRASADTKVRVHLPVHFLNQENARGVKQQGGIVSHHLIDVEVTCLPKDLPEFIEVDLTDLGLGESIHLSELKLPAGVEIVALTHGPEYDIPVVSIHHTRRTVAEEGAGPEAAPGEGEEL